MDNVQDIIMELVREVSGLKVQVATMWKFFMGIGLLIGGNIFLNILHFRNGKSKQKN